MKSKTNVKDSVLEVGKHLSTGVLGMVAGSALGRFSLAVGAVTIFSGAYYGKDWLTSAGVGMAFSNGFNTKAAPTNGIDGIQDNLMDAKDRALNSLKAVGKKLYLDKISPSLAQKMAMGAIEDRPLVFMGSDIADTGDFDTSEVDEIIQKMEIGEPLPTIDIPQDFIDGTPSQYVSGIDTMLLNGAEDVSELNAIA